MCLEKLYLSQFRNHPYREFNFTPEINFITGPNGSGKTSILEAIRYLSFGRSYRSRYDKEAISWNSKRFVIRGELRDRNAENIALKYNQAPSGGSKKQVYVDGEQLQRLSQLHGIFSTVLHHPAQLTLLTGPPGQRRQFADYLLGQTETDYISMLKEYSRSLKQRNSLLKQPAPDELLLDKYEQNMAAAAQKIVLARKSLLSRLGKLFREEIETIGENLVADLEIVYKPDLELEESIKDQFEQKRDEDQKRGYTTLGVHRDNWELQKKDGRKLEEFSSRGEQKLILTALKFAEAEYILEKSEKKPTFLLDDFRAELDQQHRGLIVDRVNELGFQFISTTVEVPEEREYYKVIELTGVKNNGG